VTSNELPIVYIWGVPAPAPGDDLYGFAMTEDGEVLATHICSDKHWLLHDLHDIRAKAYTEKFGGVGHGVHYRLVFEDPPAEAMERNRELAGKAANR
jgi:hypothetical protein